MHSGWQNGESKFVHVYCTYVRLVRSIAKNRFGISNRLTRHDVGGNSFHGCTSVCFFLLFVVDKVSARLDRLVPAGASEEIQRQAEPATSTAGLFRERQRLQSKVSADVRDRLPAIFRRKCAALLRRPGFLLFRAAVSLSAFSTFRPSAFVRRGFLLSFERTLIRSF